jgi:extracellular elastinolytic metalloproteinase
MQMFLWDGFNGGAQLDSSFDNGIIAHEYCHGMSTRLTGGAGNSGCLGGNEQAGEGWSDFCALYLTDDETRGDRFTRTVGAYAATNKNGIRPAPYSPDWSINSYTYGQAARLSNPHGRGFFFASCLWDMYLGMVEKYGYDSNRYSPTTGGNNKAFALVVDGLKRQGCRPDFSRSRDAIIEADGAINNGDNVCLIWGAFARRGLGVNSKVGFNENFEVPAECVNLRCTHFWGGSSLS